MVVFLMVLVLLFSGVVKAFDCPEWRGKEECVFAVPRDGCPGNPVLLALQERGLEGLSGFLGRVEEHTLLHDPAMYELARMCVYQRQVNGPGQSLDIFGKTYYYPKLSLTREELYRCVHVYLRSKTTFYPGLIVPGFDEIYLARPSDACIRKAKEYVRKHKDDFRGILLPYLARVRVRCAFPPRKTTEDLFFLVEGVKNSHAACPSIPRRLERVEFTCGSYGTTFTAMGYVLYYPTGSLSAAARLLRRDPSRLPYLSMADVETLSISSSILTSSGNLLRDITRAGEMSFTTGLITPIVKTAARIILEDLGDCIDPMPLTGFGRKGALYVLTHEAIIEALLSPKLPPEKKRTLLRSLINTVVPPATDADAGWGLRTEP